MDPITQGNMEKTASGQEALKEPKSLDLSKLLFEKLNKAPSVSLESPSSEYSSPRHFSLRRSSSGRSSPERSSAERSPKRSPKHKLISRKSPAEQPVDKDLELPPSTLEEGSMDNNDKVKRIVNPPPRKRKLNSLPTALNFGLANIPKSPESSPPISPIDGTSDHTKEIAYLSHIEKAGPRGRISRSLPAANTIQPKKDLRTLPAVDQDSVIGDIDTFKLLKYELSISQFNNDLKMHLNNAFMKIKNKTFRNPERYINEYCIEKLTISLEHISLKSAHLQLADEEMASTLLKEITQSNIMLKQIAENLEDLRKEIWEYCKCLRGRTEWSTLIYKALVDLLKAPSNGQLLNSLGNIAVSIKERILDLTPNKATEYLCERYQANTNTHLIKIDLYAYELILGCFGSYSNEVHSTLCLLNKWNSDQQHILLADIKAMISTIRPLVVKSKNIILQKHRLYQNASISENNFGEISFCHIKHSLSYSLRFEKIIINHEGISPEVLTSQAHLKKSTMSNAAEHIDGNLMARLKEHALEDYFLYFNLFLAIYRNFPDYDSSKVHQELNHLFKLDDEHLDTPIAKQGLSTSLLKDKFEGDIGAIGILRLMSSDCYHAATNYLLLLFPEMFMHSLSSKETMLFEFMYSQDNTCEVSIDKKGEYEVTQRKGATINLAGEIASPVATLEIEWSVKPIEIGWEGCLRIASWEILNMSYWEDIMSILTAPKGVSKIVYTPKEWSFMPDVRPYFNSQ